MKKSIRSNTVVSHLLLANLMLILCSCSGEQPPTSEFNPGTQDGPLSVGMFSFTLPPEWELASAADQRSAKREVEAGVQQMIESYSGGEDQNAGFLGIDAFKAVRLPRGGGWFIVYSVRIPPQQDYLDTLDQDQREKLEWGKRQGVVVDVVEHRVVTLGSKDAMKVDAIMRQGARSVSWYYWTAEHPGQLGTISVVVNPGHYEAISGQLDEVIASMIVNEEA